MSNVPPCPAPVSVSAATITPQPPAASSPVSPATVPPQCPAESAPVPVRGSFTVPLITGGVFTESCPSGCTRDHALDARGAFLEDLYHQFGEPVSTTVPVFDAGDGTAPMPILAAHIQVDPYSSEARLRVPHVVLEPAPDDVMECLDPVELGAVIAQVRAHCDRLDGVLARLVAARAEYEGA